MDTVTHHGIEYKKVALLAKEFNYTTDYIGQLCRADKVDARLVGRAWYVNPESLRRHKKNRYQDAFKDRLEEQSTADERPEKPSLERVSVEPVRTNKTVKIIKHIKGSYREVPVHYEADEESLIPRVVKPGQAILPPVDLAEAEPVTIKKAATTKPTELRVEQLPEASTQEKSSVTNVLQKTALPVKNLEPEIPASKAVVVTAKRSLQAEQKVVPSATSRAPEHVKKPLHTSHIVKKTLRPDGVEGAKKSVPTSFHPQRIQAQRLHSTTKKTPKQAKPSKPTLARARKRSSSRWWWVFLGLVTLTCVFVLLFLEIETIHDGQHSTTVFELNFNWLKDLFFSR